MTFNSFPNNIKYLLTNMINPIEISQKYLKESTTNLFYCKSNTTLFLDNFKNKKILVLGSGPSATEIDWANKDWDVLVTTSYFYLVPEILEQKPVHVSLSNQIDLKDKRLLDYLDNNPHCTIGFELEVSGSLGPTKVKFFSTPQYLNFEKKYKDRILNYRITRAYSLMENKKDKLEWGYSTLHEGVAGRLCWLALACEPEKLLICGIDGISKDWENDPKNYFRGHKGTGDMDKKGYDYKIYWDDFQKFGKTLYIASKESKIPIINLGKGKPYNMITNISEKYEKS